MVIDSAEVRVHREGLARKLRALGVGLLLACPVSIDVAGLAGRSLVGAPLSISFFLFFASVAAFLVAWGARRIGRGKRARVRVDGERLTIERGSAQSHIPLGDLEEGRHLPITGHVELRRKGGDVVRIAAGNDAIPLLEAAGVDASRRTSRLRLGETTFLTWLSVLLGPVLAMPLTQLATRVAPSATVALAVFLGLWYAILRAVYAAWGPEELVLGADGVRIQRAFSERFVPYYQLHKVTTSADSVWLSLQNGTLVRARARYLTAEQRDLILGHVEGARKRARESAPAHAREALNRGSQSVAAWTRTLGRLLAPQGEYRRAPITADDLENVLGNPSESPETRLGAAIALAGSKDPEVRKRVRIAAEASASVPMRVALTSIAEGEGEAPEAVIEEALTSLSTGAH